MKKNLTIKETIFVASMLFGMFFGAGNLIFPVSMGQMAGSNMWLAAAGFLITGVGLPLLGVAALGVSRQQRTARCEQPGREEIRYVFHLFVVFDDRTVFCDSEVRHGRIFRRDRADAS